MFIVGVDLGQTVDHTAIAVVERLDGPPEAAIPSTERRYHLRHLHRPPLGTKYPAIVADVLALLARAPLSRSTPLVVDRTGVGAAICDLFVAAGVRPRAITITGGDSPNAQDPWHLRVPKRDLVGVLVALFQTGRLKVAEGLELAPTLVDELANFKMKINLETGHDSYESWRESVHDDLVLSVALACWWGGQIPAPIRIIPLGPMAAAPKSREQVTADDMWQAQRAGTGRGERPIF